MKLKLILSLLMTVIFVNKQLDSEPLTKNQTKKTFTLPGGVEIKMIWVNPGEFLMGSPENEEERNALREKQHKVKITKGFWLAETEFTQGQWEKIMKNNPSKTKGASLPVEQVSYHDIQEFLEKINTTTNKFRLPTEAEWEYACRANTTSVHAGNRDEMTWHAGNSGRKSHPVSQKKPNTWGFYDMHGNILEKCSDWFQEDNTKVLIDPIGPELGEKRVDRGGQFTGRIRHTRSSDRQSSLPTNRDFFVGFRLARSVD